jgi:hypothetical protein
MTYIFPSAFMIAATAVIAGAAAPFPCHAQEGPGLENKSLYTSDIQYRFTRSPDNKTLSVLLVNFSVALVYGDGAAPAIRVLPLRIPVMDADKGTMLRIQARGGLVCPDGAACLAIIWVNGQTKVLKLSRNKTSTDFSAEAEFSLAGADVHQAAVILIAEHKTRRKQFFRPNDVAVMISVDSLDLTIAAQAGTDGNRR